MMFGPVKHSTYLRTYNEENIRKKTQKHEKQEERLLRKHWDLDVWLRTRVQEEEVKKDGGMQDSRQDLPWHTNGNGGRRPRGKVVLQAAGRGGKDGRHSHRAASAT